MDSVGSGYGRVAGSGENGDGPSDSEATDLGTTGIFLLDKI